MDLRRQFQKPRLESKFCILTLIHFLTFYNLAAFYPSYFPVYGLPWWLSAKKSTCQCGRQRRSWFDPWLGRSPGVGNGNPLRYSYLGNPIDRGAWWATVHGVTKRAQFTEKLIMLFCSLKPMTLSLGLCPFAVASLVTFFLALSPLKASRKQYHPQSLSSFRCVFLSLPNLLKQLVAELLFSASSCLSGFFLFNPL